MEPTNEKKNPKKKSKNKFKLYYWIYKYTAFAIATKPVKHPKIKSIFVAIYFNLSSILFATIAYKEYNVKDPIVEPIEK